MAHDGEGKAVSNPFQVPKNVPAHPKDDYEAANHAFWRLILANAVRQAAGKPWEEERHGRKGIVWEGRKKAFAQQLWPKLDGKELNAFYSSASRYQWGNMELMVQGHGDALSMYWVAYEWRYDAEAASAHLNAYHKEYRAKRKAQLQAAQKPSKEKGSVTVTTAQGVTVVSAESQQVLAGYIGRSVETVQPEEGPGAILRGMAEQFDSLARRERLLNQRKGEILAYLEDVVKVVREL